MTRPVAKINTAATIDDSYSGFDVLLTGGNITVTLAPSPSDGVDIRLINGDNLSGKTLVGFPPDVRTRLYPRQSVSVNSVDGSWFTTQKPGRWATPAGVIVWASSLPGASDSNDGLSPGNPLRTIGAATKFCQTAIDTQQTCPIIALVAGSLFNNDPLNLGGQPTGGNLIQVSVYGAGTATIECDDVPAINVADNAELNIAIGALTPGAILDLFGNKNDHAETATGIQHHNNGLTDISGNLRVRGNGPNCSAIFFDGPEAGAAMSDGFKARGQFGDVVRLNQGGGRYTMSGYIGTEATSSIPKPYATRLFGVYTTQTLILGGPAPAPTSSWASIGASVVGGNAILVDNGLSPYIPGASPPGPVAASSPL